MIHAIRLLLLDIYLLRIIITFIHGYRNCTFQHVLLFSSWAWHNYNLGRFGFQAAAGPPQTYVFIYAVIEAVLSSNLKLYSIGIHTPSSGRCHPLKLIVHHEKSIKRNFRAYSTG
jgi:hypothetical protein